MTSDMDTVVMLDSTMKYLKGHAHLFDGRRGREECLSVLLLVFASVNADPDFRHTVALRHAEHFYATVVHLHSPRPGRSKSKIAFRLIVKQGLEIARQTLFASNLVVAHFGIMCKNGARSHWQVAFQVFQATWCNAGLPRPVRAAHAQMDRTMPAVGTALCRLRV